MYITTMKDVGATVSKIIQELNPRAANVSISADTDLLESDILDSASTVRLVLELESHFGISFKFEDIKPENFKTIRNIILILNSKYNVDSST